MWVAILTFDKVHVTKLQTFNVNKWTGAVHVTSINNFDIFCTTELLLHYFFSLGSEIHVLGPFFNETLSCVIKLKYKFFTKSRVHISFCFMVPPLSFLVVSELEGSVLAY